MASKSIHVIISPLCGNFRQIAFGTELTFNKATAPDFLDSQRNLALVKYHCYCPLLVLVQRPTGFWLGYNYHVDRRFWNSRQFLLTLNQRPKNQSFGHMDRRNSLRVDMHARLVPTKCMCKSLIHMNRDIH
jgi:hypothetical protein